MSSIALYKSKRFAVRIVRLNSYLRENKKEFIMSKQLLRSGTSIGANLTEARYAVSRNDFLAKTYIALKETAETIYWLDLLHETGYLTADQYSSVYNDAEELRRLLSSVTKTMRTAAESSVSVFEQV